MLFKGIGLEAQKWLKALHQVYATALPVLILVLVGLKVDEWCLELTAPCTIAITSATPSACANNTYDLDVVVSYSNSPGGNITVNTSKGGTITVAATTSPQTITLTGLTANGVLGIDVTAFFVNDNTCTDDLTDAYDAPAACAICPNLPCGTTTALKN
jgi:hypothetical protein